jgi:hypothetical protein
MLTRIATIAGALVLTGTFFLYYVRPIVFGEPVDPCEGWEEYVAASGPIVAEWLIGTEDVPDDHRGILVHYNQMHRDLEAIESETSFIRGLHDSILEAMDAEIDSLITIVDDDPTNDETYTKRMEEARSEFREQMARVDGFCGGADWQSAN